MLHREDVTVARHARRQLELVRRSFRVMLPDAIRDFHDIHPDTWALLVVLAVHPFVGNRLELSFSVSAEFARVYALSRIRIEPIDQTLVARRSAATGHTKMVAFNGRPHSAVVAAMMGIANSVLCYVDHWNAATRVMNCSDNVYAQLDGMMEKGFQAKIVKTDVQTLVEPPGFATLLGSALGCVLLCEAFERGGRRRGAPRCARIIALGSSLIDLHSMVDDALRVVSFKYGDLRTEQVSGEGADVAGTLHFWREIFAAAGFDLQLPTCGMPDTLALRLLKRADLLDSVTLCGSAEARIGYACDACPECLYYGTLARSLDQQVNVERVWRQASERHPQALAPLADATRAVLPPSPWHLFWIDLVGREDILPTEGGAALLTMVRRWKRACAAKSRRWHARTADVGVPADVVHMREVILLLERLLA